MPTYQYFNKRYTRDGNKTITLVDKYELSKSGTYVFIKVIKLAGRV